MKKLLCLLLAVFSASMMFVSCSSKKSNIKVKIVVDEGADSKYEETLFDESVAVTGSDPSLDAIISQLDNDKKITVEYNQDGNGEIKSLNGKENKEEGTKIYQWMAKANGSDVKGLWKETKVKDGDSVTLIYGIWEPSK
jgi:hypothetical protein